MSNRREGQRPGIGGLDNQDDLVIAANPTEIAAQTTQLAPGVLKVVRREKPQDVKLPTSEAALDRARRELERLDAIGRRQGGTSQGSAGGGQSKRGGHNYNG